MLWAAGRARSEGDVRTILNPLVENSVERIKQRSISKRF